MPFTEANFENAILELMRDELGYSYFYGPDLERDYRVATNRDQVHTSLCKINPSVPRAAIDEAMTKIHTFDVGSLVQKNNLFHDYLQNGVEVNFYNGRETEATRVRLIDYDFPHANEFTVVNQWTVDDHSVKRADIVVFVNGLPLVVIELKSPSRENTDVSEAYAQLRNYLHEVPSLFTYNAFCVMSDFACSKAGTITAGEDRFMEWKTADGEKEDALLANFEVLFKGMFRKERLIDILKNFLCYAKTDSSQAKILAGYHQYYAVKKAIESTVRAIGRNKGEKDTGSRENPEKYGLRSSSDQPLGDRKAGVFWHTQGSGKSLSMVFYAKLLQENLDSPTIVVLTDRNDLDNQLYSQFAACKEFLRQTPVQVSSRADLKDRLKGRAANGIFFTTMQKFEESEEPLSERNNIIVMADEAHRSQYGLSEKVDAGTGRIRTGAARMVRNSFPNATFIGFTGTPIAQKDKSTREVFGDYIDVYDMTQAVADGATRPVYYESRVIHLKLNDDVLKEIDAEYEELAEKAEEYALEKSKKEFSRVESILGAKETIDSLCDDIVMHYEDSRQYEQTGKAMIVAYNRAIAIDIYKRLLELRPQWKEKIAVVMTGDNGDDESWHPIIGNASYRKELEKRFKDNDSTLKIAIVVDMWLTGFDIPSLSTMYVYKPMSGHNLMQAIARVNRVFKDKKGGLVVDYVGIAGALKKAMNDYTARDRKFYGETDVAKTAYPEFEKKLEVCRDMMHGYDYSPFFGEKDLERAKAISGGVNFLSAPDKEELKKRFIKETLLMSQAASLCKSMLNPEQRMQAAYFEAVRTLLTRISGPGKISFKEINQRISELLKQSIKSEGVINLFSDVKEEFSLFDTMFLDEIAKMKEKNFAVELLRKLIAEQVRIYERTNTVRAAKFSELLSNAMSNYLKGVLTNEEVIQELMKAAHEIIHGSADQKKLNLSDEELAFYDALTKPEAVKDFYSNDQLLAITHELTDALRKNKTIDWNRKESARAGMRRIIKRLLKKYKYPPEGEEDALNTIMAQCNMWNENN